MTPEYPKGTYHYYITDTYPFIQRCVMGTASSSGMMMGGAPGDAGMGGSTMSGDGGASCTDTSCSSSEVCCPSGQPCAGECVPNCTKGGTCPSGASCDESLGICTP